MELEDIKKASNYSCSVRNDMDDFYNEILSYPPEKRHEKWSVSWSDLMMTMFIFFAVMYVYQTGNRDLLFGKGPGKNYLSEAGSHKVIDLSINSTPSQVYDQTKQAISEVMVTQPDSVELMKDGAVRIILAGDLFFDPGRAALKIGARYQLKQIARVLNGNDLIINVVGHTDDAPTRSEQYPTNWELSSKRAVMVARYLTEVTKVDENRVFVSAHSFHQPVRPNDTSYNRALNRRVEIILVKQKPYTQPNN
ncbi:MAG: OmpA family protein [Desulfobacula sp.]|nr:OmpA family protein [Desulfobacula sp.]